MTRQQRRAQERAQLKVKINVDTFRRSSPFAEATYQQGYADGYADGWKAACDFCMKTCYAAAVLALHELEGYGTKRNTRFLRLMDNHVTETLTSEEIMNDALQKAGVAIDFRAPFEDERIQEVDKT